MKNKIINKSILVSLLTLNTLILPLTSSAVETSAELHKVDQSGSYGFSVAIGDNFFNEQAFNWQVSYNRIEEVNITWNDDDIDFSLDTIDVGLSYRYYPKSYNKFVNSLMVEFQVGTGIVVTENKFTWPDLQEEKYFSEQGDINPFLKFSIHKSLSRSTTMFLGFKHYPSYSEFDDISSVFIGFNYNFGKQNGY